MYNFENISKKKMDFLNETINNSKKIDSSEIIPFLFDASKAAAEKGIIFTNEETEYIINSLKNKIPSNTYNKIDSIKSLAKIIASSSKTTMP